MHSHLITLILRVDYQYSNELLNLQEVAEICLRCGVCCVVRSHSCHVQYDERFDAQQTYVYDCLRADDPVENPNIWLCVSCHKCEEICPYEVAPVRFIEAMKAQAFERGTTHPVIVREVEQVLSTSYAFPLTFSAARRREELELKPLQTAATEDLRRIADRTGLTRKLRSIKETRG